MNWSVPATDYAVIVKIAQRATALARRYNVNYPQGTALMDLTACHANAFRLRVEELLKADDSNFAHDVFGIRRHLDRETGKLADCFVPRFASKEAVN